MLILLGVIGLAVYFIAGYLAAIPMLGAILPYVTIIAHAWFIPVICIGAIIYGFTNKFQWALIFSLIFTVLIYVSGGAG